MKPAQSSWLDVRGVRYHCRTWGAAGAPVMFLLHGFQDVSASWQFTVDALAHEWQVVAPDWRGYGLSGRTGGDTYWPADLVADLDVLLEHFEPVRPALVIGHSMGANAAAIYAGARPDRIRRFVNIEGLGGIDTRAEEAPRRYAAWLKSLADPEGQRPYEDFDQFAERMMAENPHLTADRAGFLARHWGEALADGTVVRRADPAHAAPRPVLWRLDEAIACWRQISAPVLWIEGEESEFIGRMVGRPGGYDDRLDAFGTLEGVERIAGAGHNVHHDQPELLAAAIERFARAR
ncbi:MAG: alpha/beta fold hydrolase [Gammaproteobacteria bacterium]